MKIKKLICVLFIAMMFIGVCFGESELEEGIDYTGEPFGFDIKLGSTFTIVNNNLCSVSSDWSKGEKITVGKKCWDNRNGGSPGGNGIEHAGVVYQLFHLESQTGKVDFKVGEIIVNPGEQKCIGVPIKDDFYFRQVFYCDDEQALCEEVVSFYTAGCDFDKCDEGEVLRKRQLDEKVSGGCDDWTTEECIPDTLTGFNCDGGESRDIPSGSDGSDSEPEIKTLSGEWQNVAIPPVVAPNEQIVVNARFQAFTSGKYYLEAGFTEVKTLAIVADSSKCDGSENWAGDYITLDADETVDVTFTPRARGEEGNFQFLLGAYTGCAKDGGEKITSLTQNVKVIQDISEPVSVDKGIGLFSFATIGIIGGIFIAIIIIIVIIIIIMVMKKG